MSDWLALAGSQAPRMLRKRWCGLRWRAASSELSSAHLLAQEKKGMGSEEKGAGADYNKSIHGWCSEFMVLYCLKNSPLAVGDTDQLALWLSLVC